VAYEYRADAKNGGEKMKFVSIDFETAKQSRESACSIGLVKHLDGKAADTFYSLIRPPKLYIRPDFTEIHGLTVEDVKDAPTFADLWDSAIKPFIGGLPLAAHNAPFDMSVLWAVLEWYELEIPILRYFCTRSLSRRTWPGLESYSLSPWPNALALRITPITRWTTRRLAGNWY
jgi:DNA polymerase-3 subunit epsilon